MNSMLNYSQDALTPQVQNYEARTRAVFLAAPFIEQMGTQVEAVGPGYVRAAVPITENIHQQNGFVHGGALGTIADHVGGCAAYTLVGEDDIVLTAEFKVNLLRPAKGERVVAEGKVIKPGKTLIISEADIYTEAADKKLTLVAKGIITLAVLQPS